MKIIHITKNSHYVEIEAECFGRRFKSIKRFFNGRKPGLAETQWAEQQALNHLGALIAQHALDEFNECNTTAA